MSLDRPYRIGIFGSAGNPDAESAAAAEKLGRSLRGCTVVTGACSGLPYVAAHAASKNGCTVVGFSPVRTRPEQKTFTPDDDLSIYTALRYLPDDFPHADDLNVAKKYRNVRSTAYCDAGIIIAGGWGTLHEVCSLIDFGAVVGLFVGTGGVADEVPALASKIGLGARASVIPDDDPERLVARVFAALATRGPAETDDGTSASLLQ